MSSVTLRLVKGSPLTNQELDDNFANLNSDKMDAANNLSEITDPSAARTNIGAASTEDILALAIALG